MDLFRRTMLSRGDMPIRKPMSCEVSSGWRAMMR
jgi:hypothetical protein